MARCAPVVAQAVIIPSLRIQRRSWRDMRRSPSRHGANSADPRPLPAQAAPIVAQTRRSPSPPGAGSADPPSPPGAERAGPGPLPAQAAPVPHPFPARGAPIPVPSRRRQRRSPVPSRRRPRWSWRMVRRSPPPPAPEAPIPVQLPGRRQRRSRSGVCRFPPPTPVQGAPFPVQTVRSIAARPSAPHPRPMQSAPRSPSDPLCRVLNGFLFNSLLIHSFWFLFNSTPFLFSRCSSRQ